MRILIISPFFPPQPTVASLRVHSFATEWSGRGAEVTVLTTEKREDQRGLALPASGAEVVELPVPARWPLEHLRRADRSGENGTAASVPAPAGRPLMRLLRAARTRTGIYSGLRMPDLTDGWVEPAIAWAMDRGHWDAVVSSSGPYTAHLVALALRKAGKMHVWVADFRDLWTANHVATGLFPFTVRERALQRRCCAAADVLVAVSEGQATRLRELAGRAVSIIYNGYDETEGAALRDEHAFGDDHVHLVYTGTLYPQGQDPAPLLAGLRRLRDEQAPGASRLRLIVAGPRSELWHAPARAFGVDDLLDDRGEVPRETALRLQRDADALIAFEWRAPNPGVLTGKLLEYLQWAAPILAIGGDGVGPIGALVARCGRGMSIGSDPAAVATALGTIAADPAGHASPGDRAVVARFTRAAQGGRLLEIIGEQLVEAGPAA